MPDENCKLRPCPYLSCANHTWWLWFCEQGRPERQGMMFAKMTDTQIIEFVENLPETCIIDVIQENTTYGGRGATLNVIAGIMGITRERVRQVEEKALNKMRHWCRRSLLEHHAKDVYGVEKDPYLTMFPWAAGHREWREVN